MTIKDQWSKSKTPTYKERVSEQLNAMEALAGMSFIVGGDFNCRADLTWHAAQFATISNVWVPTAGSGQLETNSRAYNTSSIFVI